MKNKFLVISSILIAISQASFCMDQLRIVRQRNYVEQETEFSDGKRFLRYIDHEIGPDGQETYDIHQSWMPQDAQNSSSRLEGLKSIVWRNFFASEAMRTSILLLACGLANSMQQNRLHSRILGYNHTDTCPISDSMINTGDLASSFSKYAVTAGIALCGYQCCKAADECLTCCAEHEE